MLETRHQVGAGRLGASDGSHPAFEKLREHVFKHRASARVVKDLCGGGFVPRVGMGIDALKLEVDDQAVLGHKFGQGIGGRRRGRRNQDQGGRNGGEK